MISIVCWRWKTPDIDSAKNRISYSANHVNIFASMISRHVSIPYEIVCITDDPTGIDNSIKTIPIWDDLKEYGMCYRRLKIFSKKMKKHLGSKFISIDLDCVILSDITDLLKSDDDFKIWQSNASSTKYCGSMFMAKTGAMNYLWDDFDVNQLEYRDVKCSNSFTGSNKRYVYSSAYDAGYTVGSDQAYLAYKLYPKFPVWNRKDGVCNFRVDLMVREKRKRRPILPLDQAKIVFFPGKYDPSNPALQVQYPWIKEHWK